MSKQPQAKALCSVQTGCRKWLATGVGIKYDLMQLGGDLKVGRIKFVSPKAKA